MNIESKINHKLRWNREEVVRDIIEWDTGNWSRALTFWGRHTRQDLRSVKALEIGSGNGGLSLWIALQGGCCLCTDIGDPRLSAIAKHQFYGIADRIRYEALDALTMTYENTFDVVLFKSVLGGIGHHDGKDRQQSAMKAIYRALKPGGELLFAENLAASPIHRLLRRRCTAWGNYWRYVSLADMASLTAPFSEVEMAVCGCMGAFGRTERQKRLLGALDRIFIERIVPAKWRYLVFGVARK
jgi:SAM-dependent methyltransferase